MVARTREVVVETQSNCQILNIFWRYSPYNQLANRLDTEKMRTVKDDAKDSGLKNL